MIECIDFQIFSDDDMAMITQNAIILVLSYIFYIFYINLFFCQHVLHELGKIKRRGVRYNIQQGRKTQQLYDEKISD